ncbi:hypothetical protein [Saliphagus sp. LR7]|uniref:hypothetical protein n=1 Tax=Saliphagus sp. LR7 TaxID=2282654 RepID=UPI00130065A7|nr:hypothetical protein [Saliphagus sp. LR7]
MNLRPDAQTRVVALAARSPAPPVIGGLTHGDPCPRCGAATMAGCADVDGQQVLECERCLYRPANE